MNLKNEPSKDVDLVIKARAFVIQGQDQEFDFALQHHPLYGSALVIKSGNAVILVSAQAVAESLLAIMDLEADSKEKTEPSAVEEPVVQLEEKSSA